MILNKYEYSSIKNKKLPNSWQEQRELDELERFLQENWEQRGIFYDDGEVSSKQQFLKFLKHGGIKTQKYVGTIVFNGEQLNIFPKVFKTEKDDDDTEELSQEHLMKNLINWLEYCNKIEYPFISIASELEDTDNLRELFVTLYISYVNSAIERGLFYRYVEETDDIKTIKGKFDFQDYVFRKIPRGRTELFRCSYSTFEFDNDVNRIIKCVCSKLVGETKGKNNKRLHRILTKLESVKDVKCKPSDCNGIRLSKMHANYRIIISMSKMFLLNQMANYSIDTNEAFCFLFPTELLFEGFVGGFLQETLEPYGGNVRLQTRDKSLFDDVKYKGKSYGSAISLRPDIIVELENAMFVLDTKYKEVVRFEDNEDEMNKIVAEETNETDVYQVCEYARNLGLSDVYLLYPMYRFEEKENAFPVGESKDPKGIINVHLIRLPYVFEEDEEDTKNQLKDVLIDIFEVE